MKKEMGKARQKFRDGVTKYLDHQNHSLFLEVIYFIFHGIKHLYGEAKDAQKVEWLKVCLNSACEMEKHILKIYERDR